MMIDQAFKTLEYGPLLGLIRRYAQTAMGQARIENLVPFDSLDQLQTALLALAEAIKLREKEIVLHFSEITDPEPALARLRVQDAALDPLSILQLARICEQALAARSLLQREHDDCPVLWQIVEGLPRELNSLVARITNKILPGGEIDDRASPELGRIRHDISRLRSQITRSLESLMRNYSEAIQDPLVTFRNERFVIPVKSDHRGRLAGVAHGFSSSGATVFVEPLATIDDNNELQSLREAEEREIARVLLELSENLRSLLPGIEDAARALEELDFVNAKARFSEKFAGVVPEISSMPAVETLGEATTSGRFELLEARHPLLEENLRASSEGVVVPVSLWLDGDHSAMVISGANAGGKTVALKTAGLLSLMALSGLPVLARAARVPFYQSVLADIGDHQSLAANLSTFTSHVANIATMIRLCRKPALVLLDEVGTGTDPEEGSALGVAVVDHFRRQCEAHVIATTHYGGLKMYAATEAGVLNASVEFDEKTLQPTYQLIVGVAGSSSGLEIARRFGIPNQVIAAASSLVSSESLQAGDYLQRLKRETEEATALRAALEEERIAVAEEFAALDQKAKQKELDRQKTFDAALTQALKEFEKQAREIVSVIEDRAARLKLERETQKRKAELSRAARQSTREVFGQESETAARVRIVRDGQLIDKSKRSPEKQADVPRTSVTPQRYKPATEDRPIRVGDRVRLRSFGSVGIVDQIKDDEVDVRVNALRLKEKLQNLELVEEVAPASRAETKSLESLRGLSAEGVRLTSAQEPPAEELNVIGQTTDEAVDAVDKFLDKAALASLVQVRIVHGHGTGALRRAISELLQGHPHVSKFAQAPPDQGGGGATIVELSR